MTYCAKSIRGIFLIKNLPKRLYNLDYIFILATDISKENKSKPSSNLFTMKKLSAVFIMMLFIISAHKGISNNLIIKKTTIYNEGAEIHGTAILQLEQGRNEIEFKRLSPFLDPATIQISGQGFRVLSISRGIDVQLDDKAYKDSVSMFQKKIDELELKIREKNTLLRILEKEERVLMANQKIAGEGSAPSAELRNTLEYLFSRIERIENKRFETSEEIKTLSQEVNNIKEQINNLVKPEEELFSTVTFVLQSARRARVPVEIRYWVNQAGWFPTYDIFARDGNLEISYNANIRQQTGSDWKSVELTVSSASPYKSQLPPRLLPFRLNFGRRPAPTAPDEHAARAHDLGIYSVSGRVVDSQDGQTLPGTSVMVKGTTIGTVTNLNGEFQLQLPSEARVLTFSFIGMITQEVAIDRPTINVALEPDFVALEEVVVIGYGTQDMRIRGVSSDFRQPRPAPRPEAPPTITVGHQTSFSYQIDVPYDVPSSPQPTQVEISRMNIPATMRYTAVPAIEPAAFLTARISDWEQYNLLEGEANLYLDNQFMGRSVLQTRFVEDTLAISLGRDESIIINRKRQREYEQRRFWSNRVREERMWHTAIRNTKREKIMLELLDQIPVSQTADIKVDVIDISGASLDKDTGILTWNLEIEPGETREVIIHYSVEYPRGRVINLD